MYNTKTFAGQLSEADKKRLDRVGKRRGRNKPSKVPARLVRTSAFAPKTRGLITDSAFERLYIVPGHSVVRVSGRELGSQHRDALYAVFRMPHKEATVKDGRGPVGYSREMYVDTTWRHMLLAMGNQPHANNVATLKYVLEEIKKVVVTVHEGREQKILEDYEGGKLPHVGGKMGNLLNDIEWEGVGLDDRLRISFGDWTVGTMAAAKLVSLNADVQFALGSDYAKSFWPYIDSMNGHNWVDEDTLSVLVGRDLWSDEETSLTRGEFRKACRKAFDDMVRVEGLRSWRVEVRGAGRKKTHRYHYVHGLDVKQMELPLLVEQAKAERAGETVSSGPVS